MNDLFEREPKIAAIVDRQTSRDLLDPSDPNPLVVDLVEGADCRFELEIHNGPEGMIDLAISSDEAWLQPERSRVVLVGGEKSGCKCIARHGGDTEFANLLFSWEGEQSTQLQSVMLMRRLSAGKGSGGRESIGNTGKGASANNSVPSAQEERSRASMVALRYLEEIVERCAADAGIISSDDENRIFRKGGDEGLTYSQIESAMHRKCKERGWGRESRLLEKLAAMLKEATLDDGVIDKKEFSHIVNFAVKRKLDRNIAEEKCVTLMLDSGWRARESMLDKWFSKSRKKFNL
jgi:hypothetical protein